VGTGVEWGEEEEEEEAEVVVVVGDGDDNNDALLTLKEHCKFHTEKLPSRRFFREQVLFDKKKKERRPWPCSSASTSTSICTTSFRVQYTNEKKTPSSSLSSLRAEYAY